ncbi:2-dehydro-3-deoxy-D-gluconate 5-dehydrogenase KduD [Paenibacillus sp. FSL W7-1287]|uniref:2-dehydro-3-deoxy-D-gluconate 5-dehydrogenase KduD n=1 Tax=Paenibacillus sp. FSL W7-1287 TaxID=2954538 RepID=UPI0030FA0528
MNLFNLKGKCAIVTGAARGLGQAIAIGLAEAGADLVLVTNQSPAEETQAHIKKLGQKAIIVKADVSDQAQLPVIIEQAKQAFGRIDILVNNAGIIRRTPAVDYSFADWQAVLSTNLDSVFTLSQLAGKEMIEQGSGKIINIASMLSFQGGINVPAYTASKHAVAGLTKALANEWASKGVQVNAIAPGYMATDNTAALRADEVRSKQILERIPAARWGTNEDLKGAAVFLSSNASDYVNGHVLCVDGGWMNR